MRGETSASGLVSCLLSFTEYPQVIMIEGHDVRNTSCCDETVIKTEYTAGKNNSAAKPSQEFRSCSRKDVTLCQFPFSSSFLLRCKVKYNGLSSWMEVRNVPLVPDSSACGLSSRFEEQQHSDFCASPTMACVWTATRSRPRDTINPPLTHYFLITATRSVNRPSYEPGHILTSAPWRLFTSEAETFQHRGELLTLYALYDLKMKCFVWTKT